MSQREIILEHLEKFKTITTFESFSLYGITDLQKAINLLRKDYIITDEWISSTNRFGRKVQYKKYFLEGKK